jgi:radical SAM superfamily enzyme YgiQ (UPF0313 family)
MIDVIILQLKSGDYIERRIKPYIPLSALSCVSKLTDKYNIKIIDLRVTKNWKKVLISYLKDNPICVGMTLKVGKYIKYGLEAAKIIRQHSNTVIVAGGIHPSLMPKQTIENELIDIVVCGEGEDTFSELVNTLKSKKNLNLVKGIWYKEKGKIKKTSSRISTNFNNLPEIPYNLINMNNYFNENGNDRELIMETSRGCPNRCTFCYNTYVNRGKWRYLSEEKLIYRIKYLINKYKINSFAFIDDNFFTDKSRVIRFANKIIDEKINIKWSAGGLDVNTAYSLDEDFINLIEKSGCINVVIGAETGSKRILKDLKKNGTLTKIIDFNRRIKKHKLRPNYFFCVGFPNETMDDLKHTTKLIVKLLQENNKASIAKIFCYNPIFNEQPELINKYVNYDGCKKLEDWIKLDWKTANFPWISKKFKKWSESLYFLSLFLDEKDESSLNNSKSRFLSKLMNIYRHVALFRIKYNIYGFMIEKYICEKIEKI